MVFVRSDGDEMVYRRLRSLLVMSSEFDNLLETGFDSIFFAMFVPFIASRETVLFVATISRGISKVKALP